MNLTEQQYKQLKAALTHAFPYRAALKMMVRSVFNENIEEIASDRNLAVAVDDLIEWAGSEGKLEELVRGAHNLKPGNPKLKALFEELFGPFVPAQEKRSEASGKDGRPEEIVLPGVNFVDFRQWLMRHEHCFNTICRIEMPVNSPRGTGFLIGAGILITNYHVMKSISGQATPQEVIFRFDYNTDRNGRTQDGTEYALADDRPLTTSLDDPQELDYVLLRIRLRSGSKQSSNTEDLARRKWLTPYSHNFIRDETLCIIQHPKGNPLSITSGPITDQNKTRVYYKANTVAGSSGSPCFTSDGHLVALHSHGGSTDNEGIPFSAILKDLGRKNLLSIICK